MKIAIEERKFHFRQPAGTSRGVYTERRSWLVRLSDGHSAGIGECAPLPRLSCDDLPDYGERLRAKGEEFVAAVEEGNGAVETFFDTLRDCPSMLFGLETALLNLRHGDCLYDTAFTRGEAGIPINGLVWMGTYEEMLQRIEEKLAQGFRCVKLKIGAIGFDQELLLIRRIRERFGPQEVELRVDANGAFACGEALRKLEQLSQYRLHSIEQPIRAGQWEEMARLCRQSPLPIALDEELIGINTPERKRQLLTAVRPAYIILKPSLHGGMAGTREWIAAARDLHICSWITSALESNVGLNAIAQLCSHVYGDDISMPQGLGTGRLFTDNIPMPIEIRGDRLWISRPS